MITEKKEINDVVSLAIELRDMDRNKFSEIKGIMQGVLLFSKKEKINVENTKEHAI